MVIQLERCLPYQAKLRVVRDTVEPVVFWSQILAAFLRAKEGSMVFGVPQEYARLRGQPLPPYGAWRPAGEDRSKVIIARVGAADPVLALINLPVPVS